VTVQISWDSSNIMGQFKYHGTVQISWDSSNIRDKVYKVNKVNKVNISNIYIILKI